MPPKHRDDGRSDRAHAPDPEVALCAIGSLAGGLRDAVGRLREAGVRVGLVRLRLRPPYYPREGRTPPKRWLYTAAELRELRAIAHADRGELGPTGRRR